MSLERGHPDLAIIIPVWNLPKDLCALLEQVAEMGCFSEVIVVDDASDPPCDPTRLGFNKASLNAPLIYLRSDQQRGAGHARNQGLAVTSAQNVLFFDADDQLSENFVDIWHRHTQAGCPDFTIFRHNDTRILEQDGRSGSFPFEEILWADILGDQGERLLTAKQRADLSPITAYPWNKIYRTEFLKSQGLSCSETPVHNDIRLHWLSFIKAQNVLAVRQIGATHVIGHQRGHHLTNRRGTERLCLDGILEALTAEVRATPNSTLFIREFLYFVDNVCQWNFHQASPALQPQFATLACSAYLRFTPDEFELYAVWQPERADAIVRFLLQEGHGQ